MGGGGVWAFEPAAPSAMAVNMKSRKYRCMCAPLEGSCCSERDSLSRRLTKSGPDPDSQPRFSAQLAALLLLVGRLAGRADRNRVARWKGLLDPSVQHLLGMRVGPELDIVHRIARVGLRAAALAKAVVEEVAGAGHEGKPEER